MYDGASRFDTAAHQRAVGELRVAVKRRDGLTVLDNLRQMGCLKARFPRAIASGWMDVTTLNTSGGVAGGDLLDSAFAIGPGARATIAAQAAERFYRALPGSAPSRIQTRVAVAQGGAAEWLPQETILFNDSLAERRLEVDLAPDAWFLGVEMLVFGRAAMGERLEQGRLHDLIRLRRGGVLLLHDAIRLDGPVHALLRRPAIAAGTGAAATLVHVAVDAEASLTPVRDALAGSGAECGVSAWNGMLIARMLGTDGAAVRHAVIAALAVLRGSRPLPRVWLC
jgi:urease accessory protein